MPSEWFYPLQPLREYISTYILSDYGINGFVDATTYMYPIGSAVLCFSLDKPAVFKEISSGQIIRHARFNFIHQFKEPRFYQVLACPTKVLHVIFKPYGAYRLLGMPQNCSFDEYGTSLLNMLSDKIMPLLNQIDVGRIRHACMLIEMNQGSLPIEQLAERVCLSKRALQYLFQEQVGLSPKLYSRITRFNSLLPGIKNNKLTDWQEIVFKYKYFDQAHFIKEFKHFSGNPPAHLPEIRAILS